MHRVAAADGAFLDRHSSSISTLANGSVKHFCEIENAWPIGLGSPSFGCTEERIGFTIPAFQTIPIERPMPPDIYPLIAQPQGLVSPIATGVAGAIVGGLVGAGFVASKKVERDRGIFRRRRGAPPRNAGVIMRRISPTSSASACTASIQPASARSTINARSIRSWAFSAPRRRTSRTSPSAASRTPSCVLGLGNVLMSDDGFGPAVVRAVADLYAVGKQVDVVDVGTPGSDLAPLVRGCRARHSGGHGQRQAAARTVCVYDKADLIRTPPSARAGPRDPGVKEALLAPARAAVEELGGMWADRWGDALAGGVFALVGATAVGLGV